MNKLYVIGTKEKAIKHYNSMLKFIKQQPQNHRMKEFSKTEMLRSINQDWHGNYCSFCVISKGDCSTCLLNPTRYNDSIYCCNGLWQKMNNIWSNFIYNESGTWGEFYIAMKKVKNYIKKTPIPKKGIL